MDLNKKINEQEKIIYFINEGIDSSINETWWSFFSDDKENSREEEISDMHSKLDKLEKKIGALTLKSTQELPFQKIWIRFKNEVSLDIESLSSPEFQRNLKDTMYFRLFSIDEQSKIMYLKTDSFPDTIVIKLQYSTLETYRDQYGEVNLIYNQYGSLSVKDSVKGNEKDVYFTVIDKK
jgi:hypothetical protein